MKKIWAFSALKRGSWEQSSYEKMKMGEAQFEERKHQIAQELIERILKQADRPRPRKAARLSIRVHRVHIKVRHFIVTRFLGRLRARMLFLMSWIASKAKSRVDFNDNLLSLGFLNDQEESAGLLSGQAISFQTIDSRPVLR